MKSFFTAAAILASVSQLASAQLCGTTDTPDDSLIFPPDAGDCGTDPNDGSDFEILLQACPTTIETLSASLTFTGTDNQVTTTVAVAALTSVVSATPVTLSFPGLPNTDFSSGGVISTSFSIDDGSFFDVNTETYSPVTSIFFATGTTTITTLVTDATTTSTVKPTFTSTATRSTVTSACSTGTITKTVYTDRTTRVTVTPKPRTKTTLKVHYTTVHPSCIAATTTVRGRRSLQERQGVNQGSFEPLFCPAVSGSPVPTTITEFTSVSTATAHTDFTTTVVDPNTFTTTVTVGPATSTICGKASTTITIHPTRTGSYVTILPQKTTTVTKTHNITRTVYYSGATICRKPRTNQIKTATYGAAVVTPH